MAKLLNFKTGDKVRITFAGRTVEGSVTLASSNGRSLFLEFEAILGGYVGRMPVLRSDDGRFREVISYDPVELSPKEK